jgi:Flp pilus assembly pilin Flp
MWWWVVLPPATIFLTLPKIRLGYRNRCLCSRTYGTLLHWGRVVLSIRYWLKNFCQDESAQGITEYGAILAFVSLLVAITFGLMSGSLMPAVSNAFSAVSSQLDKMAAEAASASGS